MVSSMSTAIPFLVFLTIAVVNLSCCYGNFDVCCLENEREALQSLKQDLKDPSNRLSSWDGEEDCCKWAGVVCDNSTGHVRELHLQNPYDLGLVKTDDAFEAYKRSRLGGKINPSLLSLKHLNHLDLSQNDFGGLPIPSFIGAMASLRYLNLSEAGFEGVIPHQLGNLSSLQSLSVRHRFSYPELKLEVESLQWLSGLSSLEQLDMSFVSLSKAPNWLQVINTLPSLVELRLSNCDLHRIPPLLAINFTSLAFLDLSGNDFASLMPRWIFNLSNLVSLNLGSSNFEGPIPDGSWNLTSLKALDLSLMYLNSSLPSWLFSLDSLVSLDLRDNGFGGPLPRGLQNMTSLKYLDLSENDFNSTIPNWFYSCNGLEYLGLHSNQLQGTISSAIQNLTSLMTLDLEHNQLEGRVPRSLGNLCNLRVLTLSGNKIGGEISELFESLSGCTSNSLRSLQLDGSGLSGHLTEQILKFKNLTVLYMGGNSISGPIPEGLGRLASLEALNLEENQLNGTLPESLGQLSKLEQIYISGTLLEGVVTENHFANLTGLKELYASKNKLVLKVSPNWIPPFQLEAIELRSWRLGPKFPMWLQSQRDFWELDLSQTEISDSIPEWFWNLSSRFMYLNLSHNQIQGTIPDILQLDTTFSMIYLSSNQFSGPLPRLSSNVTELDLSNNSFSGEIFDFLCDTKDEPNQLSILHLGNNLLSGKIPDCWMNWQSLKAIKLGSNNFSGTIPSSMGLLPRLKSLHLRNNSLSGELPLSLKNCREMVAVDLGENEFVGSIPTWLGERLSRLIILGLRSNKLGGKIPSSLCHLTSLQILDLANNNLFGAVPQCINNLTAMKVKHDDEIDSDYYGFIFYSFYGGEFLENAFVVTKGREAEYNTILQLMTSMDFSNNYLSGEIPEELTSLLALRSLNMSKNHLTGMIPKNIGALSQLESVDFSRNQLSGKIPPSISALTFLSYLNLSFNNLSGNIPQSTQICGFDASSFVGNKLFGPPLTKNCGDHTITLDNAGNRDDKENKSGVDWFYISFALGFVASFWSFCGLLLYKKSWRCAYFQFLEHMWSRICNCISRSY